MPREGERQCRDFDTVRSNSGMRPASGGRRGGLRSTRASRIIRARATEPRETRRTRRDKETAMDYGVVMFPTDYSIQPDELARALEERGFESVWFPEHTHIPASRRSQWPGGGPLPREYWSAYDPFVALTAAGAATRRLRLGTGICLVIERD